MKRHIIFQLLVFAALMSAACGPPADYYPFSDLLNGSSQKCAIEVKRGNIIISVKESSDQLYLHTQKNDFPTGEGKKIRCGMDKEGNENCAIFIIDNLGKSGECFQISKAPGSFVVNAGFKYIDGCILSPQLEIRKDALYSKTKYGTSPYKGICYKTQ